MILIKFNYLINEFNPSEATDIDWEMWFKVEETIHNEIIPDDPPRERKVIKKALLDPSPYYDQYYWLIASNEPEPKVIGNAGLVMANKKSPDWKSNKHLAFGGIDIIKQYRRQGIGSTMLKKMVQIAIKNNRTTFESGATLEPGLNYCKKLDGIETNEGSENRLQLKDVDWKLMESWVEEGPKKAPNVRIERFETVPDKDIEEYVEIYTETLNQQPLGESEWRAKVTPDSRRLTEKRLKDRGVTWLTLITREPNGIISGLTEIFYNPLEPQRMGQNLTGVKEQYRKRGLGKWLKALMITIIQNEFPDVKYIVTGNANNNVPMLAINDKMGFKPHVSGVGYKFDLNTLNKKLTKDKNQ
ncbi:MAG: GNAT family N-acetyltransferase [Candidatus Hodarchaeales archaeon]